MSDNGGPPPLSVAHAAMGGAELLKSGLISGVKQMMVPSIIECNGGGYIVMVGKLVHACSSLQEAFNFAAASAEQYFGPGSKVNVDMADLPRIIRPNVWERAKQAVGLGLLAIAISTGGDHGKGTSAEYALYWEQTEGPRPCYYRKSDAKACEEWARHFRKMDLWRMRASSDARRA